MKQKKGGVGHIGKSSTHTDYRSEPQLFWKTATVIRTPYSPELMCH